MVVFHDGFGEFFLAFDFGLVIEKQILDLFVTPKGGTTTKCLEPLVGYTSDAKRPTDIPPEEDVALEKEYPCPSSTLLTW